MQLTASQEVSGVLHWKENIWHRNTECTGVILFRHGGGKTTRHDKASPYLMRNLVV